MPADLLEFEEPVRRPAQGNRGAQHAAAHAGARALDRQPAVPRRGDPRRAVRQPDAVAARARRAPSEPARTRSTTSSGCSPTSTSSTATAASPTITRSSAASPTTAAARSRSSGTRRARDTKQKIFRNFGYARPEGYRKALRVMQLAEKFQPADRRVHRHAGRLPGHRVRGARRRRSHRRQPARDEHARGADRRPRLRRGRQRRRARHRHRRSRADAGVLGLQRHPAGGLRGDPVARRQPQGRGRRGARRSPRPICWSSV